MEEVFFKLQCIARGAEDWERRDLVPLARRLVGYSLAARYQGLLSLEGWAAKEDDTLAARMMNHLLDGLDTPQLDEFFLTLAASAMDKPGEILHVFLLRQGMRMIAELWAPAAVHDYLNLLLGDDALGPYDMDEHTRVMGISLSTIARGPFQEFSEIDEIRSMAEEAGALGNTDGNPNGGRNEARFILELRQGHLTERKSPGKDGDLKDIGSIMQSIWPDGDQAILKKLDSLLLAGDAAGFMENLLDLGGRHVASLLGQSSQRTALGVVAMLVACTEDACCLDALRVLGALGLPPWQPVLDPRAKEILESVLQNLPQTRLVFVLDAAAAYKGLQQVLRDRAFFIEDLKHYTKDEVALIIQDLHHRELALALFSMDSDVFKAVMPCLDALGMEKLREDMATCAQFPHEQSEAAREHLRANACRLIRLGQISPPERGT